MARKRSNNEGSIYKRENGSWRAQVTLDGERLGRTFNPKGSTGMEETDQPAD